MFCFDNAFELHNDIDVLKKMGLDCGLHSGSCSTENLKQAKSMLPKAFGDVLDGKVAHCTPPPSAQAHSGRAVCTITGSHWSISTHSITARFLPFQSSSQS